MVPCRSALVLLQLLANFLPAALATLEFGGATATGLLGRLPVEYEDSASSSGNVQLVRLALSLSIEIAPRLTEDERPPADDVLFPLPGRIKRGDVVAESAALMNFSRFLSGLYSSMLSRSMNLSSARFVVVRGEAGKRGDRGEDGGDRGLLLICFSATGSDLKLSVLAVSESKLLRFFRVLSVRSHLDWLQVDVAPVARLSTEIDSDFCLSEAFRDIFGDTFGLLGESSGTNFVMVVSSIDLDFCFRKRGVLLDAARFSPPLLPPDLVSIGGRILSNDGYTSGSSRLNVTVRFRDCFSELGRTSSSTNRSRMRGDLTRANFSFPDVFGRAAFGFPLSSP